MTGFVDQGHITYNNNFLSSAIEYIIRLNLHYRLKVKAKFFFLSHCRK